MAIETIQTGSIITRNPQFTHTTLIFGAGFADAGVWIDTSQLDSGSIHVVIETTATVQIRGSNAVSIPDNSDDGFQIGSDITGAGEVGLAIERLPRWLKAKVSSWTAGQVDVFALLRPMAR